MTWEAWVAVAALTLALVAVALGLAAWRAVRRRTPSFAEPRLPEKAADETRSGPPAVVFNPSKGDARAVRALVTQTATDVGMPEPLWFETTVEDPGLGQTREALERGASVVIAAGGDGTVRAVAEGLAGTGVPMGLLPLGTGNLFARNLDLPLSSQREMVATALTGRNRVVDLGWLRTEPLTEEEAGAVRGRDDASTARSAERTASGQAAKGRYLDPAHPQDPGQLEEAGAVPPDIDAPPDDPDKEHVFLVIGGLGFDAAMVAGADEDLKARLGWIAYFVAGVRHLAGRKIRATVELGDSVQSGLITARTILFANVGRLPGGVVLLPDAQIDDGYLDVAVIDTRGGLIGWADLLRKVTLQGLGIRKDLLPYSTGSIRFRRAQEVVVRTEEPEHVQVDGDLVGFATTIYARTEKGGLVVRTA
ncbi:diacylglycerol/lipid kinase family protein [Georgenia ruanii]|uniref:Diacylglycerol kinase n=1 Tax=Georgenia ruanii TaxID=348442 RepID=A0A7J9UZA2_9MICO|nr:diacylglycerol kinase family protein [Georgenia ruanii]MPV89971.1 diacylglycerol kinase [Georgenia ruanii]